MSSSEQEQQRIVKKKPIYKRDEFHRGIKNDYNLYFHILMEIFISSIHQRKIYEILAYYYNFSIHYLSTIKNEENIKMKLKNKIEEIEEYTKINDEISEIKEKFRNKIETIDDKIKLCRLEKRIEHKRILFLNKDKKRLEEQLLEKKGEIHRRMTQIKNLINKENVFEYYDLGQYNYMFLQAIEQIFPTMFDIKEIVRKFSRVTKSDPKKVRFNLFQKFKRDFKQSEFSLATFLFGIKIRSK